MERVTGTEVVLDEKIFYREIEKKDTLDKAIIAVEELIVRYSSFMVKVLNRAAQTDDQTAAELVDQGMRGINHLSIALLQLNDLLAMVNAVEHRELDGELHITTDQENKNLIVSAFGENAALRLDKKKAQWMGKMLIDQSQSL